MKNRDLTIRTATPAGHNALRGLADRDSARPLTGLVLIAERESVPMAAVALATAPRSPTRSSRAPTR